MRSRCREDSSSDSVSWEGEVGLSGEVGWTGDRQGELPTPELAELALAASPASLPLVEPARLQRHNDRDKVNIHCTYMYIF